jgi:hypothetical protein
VRACARRSSFRCCAGFATTPPATSSTA